MVGCGSGHVNLPGSVSIDERFTADQTQVVLTALDRWKTASHGVANLSATIGTGGDVHIEPGTLSDSPEELTLGLTTLTNTRPSNWTCGRSTWPHVPTR